MKETTTEITFKTPFDRHGHLRELESLLKFVLTYTVRQFFGMVVMPNLTNPITTYQRAMFYRNQIFEVLRLQKRNFNPIMTAYLTDNTDPANIKEGFERDVWRGGKLYPFGATTNSDKGVTKLEKIFDVLEIMEEIKMPLLVHPETDVSRYEISFFDRERVYTDESLTEIHKRFPGLIISVEHITTKEACQFVESCPNNVVGTITPQHIMYDNNALFHNGVPPYKPGFYAENMCLPILKYKSDVDYIRNAIMFGNKRFKFGAGTDTAPHDQIAKHDHCSRCGVYNAPNAVEFYAMVFEEMGCLNTKEGVRIFERFMSENNLWIYQIESSKETVTLVKEEQIIPEIMPGNIRPFKAGQTIHWTLKPRILA